MNPRNTLVFEAIWWLFTALLVIVVMFPIFSEVPEYPFWWINTIAIVVFVTATRYIFLLKFTPLARQQIVKGILVLLSVPLIFNLVNNINFFQTYLDEEGILSVMGHLPPARIDALEKYMRAQMILFGVGSVIASVVLTIRLIISIWRLRNKGTI